MTLPWNVPVMNLRQISLCHSTEECHRNDHANDLLYTGQKALWIHGERIDNPNSHGTGCTLSSTIAANLAKGYTLEDAVKKAKEYLTEALRIKLDLGKGHGPVDHTLGGSILLIFITDSAK